MGQARNPNTARRGVELGSAARSLVARRPRCWFPSGALVAEGCYRGARSAEIGTSAAGERTRLTLDLHEYGEISMALCCSLWLCVPGLGVGWGYESQPAVAGVLRRVPENN